MVDRIPKNTNFEEWSERHQLSGHYLPRIAIAKAAERQQLLCELVEKLFDTFASRRVVLVNKVDDIPVFSDELNTYRGRIVEPMLPADLVLDDAERAALDRVVAGCKHKWLSAGIKRVNGALPDSAPEEDMIFAPPTQSNNDPELRRFTGSPTEEDRVFRDAHHPKFMYHSSKPPVQVFSYREMQELGPEWSEVYIYQEYPKCKYHRTGKTITVRDADEEATLGEGWGDSSAGPFGLQDGNPLKWFDTWDLGFLSTDGRRAIRAGLAKAHADVIDGGPDHDDKIRYSAMRKLFDVIAGAFLGVGVLDDSKLTQSIPEMVYDTAVSSGWQSGASQQNARCTVQFGHYWVPRDVPQTLTALFEAQVWRWRAELEAKPLSREPQSGPTGTNSRGQIDPRPDEAVAARAARRKAVVDPILELKRWRRGRLVTESGVGKATVYGYLDGTRARIDKNNRKAIADCLGLGLDKLPD